MRVTLPLSLPGEAILVGLIPMKLTMYVISEYWRHVSEIAAEMEKLQSVDIDPIRNTDCPLCDPKPGDIKQEIAKTGHAEHRARYPDSKIPECLMCQHNHFGHGVSGSDEVPR